MQQRVVLIGFAEALSAPEVVWSLVDDGFRVIAFARKGRKSTLEHSRHVVCHQICAPESDLQRSLSDIRSLLVSLGGDTDGSQRILFPLDDTAVRLCSMLQLEGNWLLAGPHGANADFALNKCLQVQAAREAGLNVPDTVLARSAKDILDNFPVESLPIILKPSDCVPISHGRIRRCRKWICATPAELERAITEWGERVPLLVQTFIAGTGEGIFGLATPEGVQGWSAHRRLRMMNPQGSGSSACIAQPVNQNLVSKVQEFIRRVEWQGLFMIEFLQDLNGNTWFVELNGRPWGSMALSRRQGLEYPAWQVRLAIEQRLQFDAPLSTVPGLVCKNLGRELMHLLFVLRGPKSMALHSWPSFWKSMREVLHVRRTDTFYNWRWDDPKVFFVDCYNTIQGNIFKSRN